MVAAAAAAAALASFVCGHLEICYPLVPLKMLVHDKEMLNEEQESLRERVADLEIKVLEQAEELTCLRTTIADLTRRLTQLEGRAPTITNTAPLIPHNGFKHSYSHRSLSSKLARQSSGPSNLTGESPTPSGPHNPHVNGHSDTPDGKRFGYAASLSSLHSEGSSSTRSTPQPPHQQQQQPRHKSLSAGNLQQLRRVNGGSSPNIPTYSVTPNGYADHAVTRDCVFDPDDGIIRFTVHGHQLLLPVPTDLVAEYSLTKVNPIPQQRPKLEWVYGYRGRDCRANLHLLPTGEVIYFVASVVVLYNVEEQVQRHYLGHTDDIRCIAIHPNKLVVATGQTASIDRRDRRPHVRVWDSVSLNTLHVIGIGEFDRAISCLAFSKLDGGSILCIVDDSAEHILGLWEWQKGHKIAETKSASEPVLAVKFHPMDRHQLISLGKGHLHFWDMEGGTLAKRVGLFDKAHKPKYILCAAFNELGELLTGDSNGALMVWPRGANKASRIIEDAHEGPIFSICAMKDGTLISGGGKDRLLIEWSADLEPTGRNAELAESSGGVRTLVQGRGSQLLIGTTRNCIAQGSFEMSFSTVVQGHSQEVWALAAHPTQAQFLSSGYDGHINLFDSMSHSVVWSLPWPEPVQSIAFSPCGSIVAVASTAGNWSAFCANTRKVYAAHHDGNEPIDVIRYAPNGQYLALASRDNFIYVYQVSEDGKKYNRIGRCAGHGSATSQLDWSECSTYLQTTNSNYEIVYWNATICRPITNPNHVKDVKWATQTCPLGFSVFGVWSEQPESSDISCVSRSHNRKLLAIGDDCGKLKLFVYPANEPRCLYHTANGHSSQMAGLAFLPDDSRLVSIGGKDFAVMQWCLQ
ncbi:echinoderm microtubule-associated protein-like 2 isoform X2 [Varroa jacobsoni]|uniref:Echinoderm microtubule-associated protein-like 2 n=1 Tax=Varroa destructor TaxID=109461 RepID=A0A7M7M9D0_VARDE|nr:echinoderm microtubule-associated protein-like 2 isoform X5 [Varroa destructor]XP_022706950.1 echinoderm microtubule-associated protein-like 2 isoform X2 [Varroa jacobsoni]